MHSNLIWNDFFSIKFEPVLHFLFSVALNAGHFFILSFRSINCHSRSISNEFLFFFLCFVLQNCYQIGIGNIFRRWCNCMQCSSNIEYAASYLKRFMDEGKWRKNSQKNRTQSIHITIQKVSNKWQENINAAIVGRNEAPTALAATWGQRNNLLCFWRAIEYSRGEKKNKL